MSEKKCPTINYEFTGHMLQALLRYVFHRVAIQIDAIVTST